MDRFTGTVKELTSVDVKAMVAWIKSVPFEYWPPGSKTELKPAMVTDPDWYDFGKKAWPVIQELGFHADSAFNLMLSAIMPGYSIPPHKDLQAAYWVTRIHVPLLTNTRAYYRVEGKDHPMKVGKAYKINTLREHSAGNLGTTPRVHFMFDVRR